MEESNVSKCKVCGGLELRIQEGFFPGGKNKRYVNAEGLQWNGRTCPICVKSKAKTHIKEKRANDKKAKEVSVAE